MGISLCPPLLPLDQAIHEKSAQVDIEEVIEKNPVVDGAQFALDVRPLATPKAITDIHRASKCSDNWNSQSRRRWRKNGC